VYTVEVVVDYFVLVVVVYCKYSKKKKKLKKVGWAWTTVIQARRTAQPDPVLLIMTVIIPQPSTHPKFLRLHVAELFVLYSSAVDD
jgi:hypothetical protein